jgi:hypothetical protein
VRLRRAHRFPLVAGALALVCATAAYGCGLTEVGSLDVSGDSGGDGVAAAQDGSKTTTGDGAPTTGDAIADAPGDAPDGASPKDASDDADADADADAGGVDAAPPPGPLAPDYVDYDVNHILETGQSNAIASGGRPGNTLPAGTTYTSVQPYTNIMFDTGVMTAGPKPGVPDIVNCNGSGCPATSYRAPTSFVPLIENDSFFGGGDRVETISAVMANEISSLAASQVMFGVRAGYPLKHDILASLHGRSGNTYWCLRKGGCDYKPASEIKAFDEAMLQVQAGKTLAAAAGKTYVVRAVTTVHGESDMNGYADNGVDEFPLPGTDGVANKIKQYDDALIEWQADYDASVKAITGQAQPVPLLVSGLSGFTRADAGKTSKMLVSTYQLSAHVRAPGKVILVAPGYIFDAGWTNQGGVLVPECLHFSLLGQQHLGEYFAKVYTQVVLKGKAWEPVRPKQITRAGNVVTVQFYVPKPPLVIDTTRVAMIAGNGFEFFDNGAAIPITSVVAAGDTVTLTLATTPVSVTNRLQYANNQPYPGCTGPGIKHGGGARGNLRDSDDTPSLKGFELFNWGVPFDIAAP